MIIVRHELARRPKALGKYLIEVPGEGRGLMDSSLKSSPPGCYLWLIPGTVTGRGSPGDALKAPGRPQIWLLQLNVRVMAVALMTWTLG